MLKIVVNLERGTNKIEIKLEDKFIRLTVDQERCGDNRCAILMSLLLSFIGVIDCPFNCYWYHYK